MSETTQKSHLIFVSYSHENKDWIRALEFDKEPGGIEQAKFWIDLNRLHSSDRWDEKATRALKEDATAAVLLISRAFLQSKAIREYELPLISERYKNGKFSLVFVPIDTVDTEDVGRALGIPNIHNLLSIPDWQRPLPREAQQRSDIREQIISAATEPHEVQNLRRNIHPKYRLVNSLGHGTMGRVFTAHDSQLERLVAIKLLRKRECDHHFKESVQKVVRATNHTNMLSVYGAYLDSIPPHFVRQYAPGDSLRTVMENKYHGNPLPIEMVREMVLAIGAAIDHANSEGVSGINLKPCNIIVANLSEPARRKYFLSLNSYRELDLLPDENWRTEQDNVLYLPPEYRRELIDELNPQRADQYRVGLVAYEMLIGSTRFAELAKPLRQLNLAPPWTWPKVATQRIDCPKYVCEVVDLMISEDPYGRYESTLAAVREIDGTNLDVELVRDSYRRLMNSQAGQTEFFRGFYMRFLGTYQDATKFFKRIGELKANGRVRKGWQRQFQALKEAVLLLVVFNAFHEDRREPNILTRIAEEHAQKCIPATLYEAFAEVLINTVREAERNAPISMDKLMRAWRNVIRPGIAYMVRRTSEVERERYAKAGATPDTEKGDAKQSKHMPAKSRMKKPSKKSAT